MKYKKKENKDEDNLKEKNQQIITKQGECLEQLESDNNLKLDEDQGIENISIKTDPIAKTNDFDKKSTINYSNNQLEETEYLGSENDAQKYLSSGQQYISNNESQNPNNQMIGDSNTQISEKLLITSGINNKDNQTVTYTDQQAVVKQEKDEIQKKENKDLEHTDDTRTENLYFIQPFTPLIIHKNLEQDSNIQQTQHETETNLNRNNNLTEIPVLQEVNVSNNNTQFTENNLVEDKISKLIVNSDNDKSREEISEPILQDLNLEELLLLQERECAGLDNKNNVPRIMFINFLITQKLDEKK